MILFFLGALLIVYFLTWLDMGHSLAIEAVRNNLLTILFILVVYVYGVILSIRTLSKVMFLIDKKESNRSIDPENFRFLHEEWEKTRFR